MSGVERAGAMLIAAAAATVVGALAFGHLAETELGGEVATIATRLGIPPAEGASGRLFDVVETIAPGSRSALEGAATRTALGGAAIAVIVYALVHEVLT